MIKKLTLNLICLLSFVLLLSCKPAMDTAIGTPKIKAGTAKLTGKIISPKEKPEDQSFVEIFVPHPISGELSKYKTAIDQSGSFSIDVDVETDVSLIGLYTSLKPYHSLLVKVRSGGTTNIDITYNQNLEIEKVQTKPEMNEYEMMRSLPIINQMLGVYDSKPEPQMPLDDTSPAAFMKHIKNRVSEKLKTIDQDALLSKEWKEVLSRDFRIWYYRVGAFDYEKSMKMAFRNAHRDTALIPGIQKIDKSYFGFLKDLNLNNPQYLICSSFPDFQKKILENDLLALPKIEESNIPSWIAGVKATLSGLVELKDGQYYDILAANAYGRQLNEEKKPLTEKQKKNIADYWKDGEIAKILLRKNQQARPH
ncbi:MAG: hypothetical protein V4594_12890 [Bacteroidota bacterium]